MDKSYISNLPLNHMVGSKLLKIINLIGYSFYLKSKNHNIEFVYTPLDFELNEINLSYNQLNQYNYPYPISNQRETYLELCKRWDNYLNYNGLKITDVDTNLVEFLIHPKKFNETEDFVFNEIHKFKDDIKNLFSLRKKDEQNNIKISIHIRRGDVDQSFTDRWLPDEYYLNIIKDLEVKYNGNFDLTIYTQRNNFNPDSFVKYKIIYDDESLDYEVWSDLINSDILVIGKSAYSYSAGMLCDGVVVYPEEGMFHPKINSWIYNTEILSNKI
jgi:hypothetical protein